MWEDCLPFVEFAYNRAVHSTTNCSPFETVYGFNPLTPIDLLPLPPNKFVSVDAYSKSDWIKKIHQQVKERIDKKNAKVAARVNKGRKPMIFQPGDLVWVHFRKERFPLQRKSKLNPRGDGPFQILERINDNAYKVDLPSKYNVSPTFNVTDLSPFAAGDVLDSRTNPFEERGNVMDQPTNRDSKFQQKEDELDQEGEDHFQVISNMPQGPITRSRAKKIQQALICHLQDLVDSACKGLNGQQDLETREAQVCYNLVQVQILQ